MEYTKQRFHIQLNSDTDFVRRTSDMIEKNGGYCINATEKTADTKCMCKEFCDQEEEGFCRCKLYYKTLNYDVEE